MSASNLMMTSTMKQAAAAFPHLSKLDLLINFDIIGQAVNNPTIIKLTELERSIFTAAFEGNVRETKELLQNIAAKETALECKLRPYSLIELERPNLQIMVSLAVYSKNALLVELLLKFAKQHNIAPEDVISDDTIGQVASRGLLEVFSKLQAAKPDCVNESFSRGLTPLGVVVGRSTAMPKPTLSPEEELEFVKFLLEKGADPNAPNGWFTVRPFGWHLQNAAQLSPLSVLRSLIAHGATVRQSGALQRAVMANRCAALDILVKHGGDVNERLEWPVEESEDPQNEERLKSEAPLHVAVRYEKKEAIVWLLDHGSDINAVDCNGKTAMDVAIEIGSQDLLGLLKDYMAWKSPAINMEKDDMVNGKERGKFESRFLKAEGWTAQFDDQSKGERNWEVWREFKEEKKWLCLL